MLTTHAAKYAHAMLFVFIPSNEKYSFWRKGFTDVSTCSGMWSASRSLTSCRNAGGLFIMRTLSRQSNFFFAPFIRKAQAAHTSVHSTGGFCMLFSSWISFCFRQSTAFFASFMAGMASSSSLEACSWICAASAARGAHFSSSLLAASCSLAATALAAVTCFIRSSVASFLPSTCCCVACKSSRREVTFSCTSRMISRPAVSLSTSLLTPFCLLVSILR
mmetsp:Transcript_71764/g.200258  ORF Transcript_71764/g.200258 Transcript_71764/m.200258 type:complete len:219 (-) Transcript_71764:2501-3157(-)